VDDLAAVFHPAGDEPPLGGGIGQPPEPLQQENAELNRMLIP
jgi:hypothetical protein